MFRQRPFLLLLYTRTIWEHLRDVFSIVCRVCVLPPWALNHPIDQQHLETGLQVLYQRICKSYHSKPCLQPSRWHLQLPQSKIQTFKRWETDLRSPPKKIYEPIAIQPIKIEGNRDPQVPDIIWNRASLGSTLSWIQHIHHVHNRKSPTNAPVANSSLSRKTLQ